MPAAWLEWFSCSCCSSAKWASIVDITLELDFRDSSSRSEVYQRVKTSRSDENAINPSKMIRLSDKKNSTVNVLGYVLAAISCMFFSHSSRRCDLHFMLPIILNCRSEKSTTTKVYLRPVNSFENRGDVQLLLYCPLPAYLLPYELFCWECHSYVPRLYVGMQTVKNWILACHIKNWR